MVVEFAFLVSFLLDVTKAGSHCCKLPLETPEKGKEIPEVGGSPAAAKEVSVVVSSELSGIFRFTEEQRSVLQALLGG